MKDYEAVIGLEIHAELKTGSKMFCSCCNDPFFSEPNTNICPICLGMPGTLPVLNKQAIDWTIKTGLALNCQIASITKWDRKNYFYPDLPKGYQISQYDLPICYGGYLEVTNSYEELQGVAKSYNKNTTFSNQSQPLATNRNRKINITRIHLEEDTGTLKHPEGRVEVDYSLADYNRAGVPLMELVTEPDIRTAEEAKRFCQQYQLILRTLKVSNADMEKGQLRCEANISLREKSKVKSQKSKLGTKVEIKNLNSFKSVERAIRYEINRQADVLRSGGKIIQETRGWDDRQEKTYVMRTKETSADYRYFPEPDLPPVVISKKEIEKIKKEIPELPDKKIKKYSVDYRLPEQDAAILANNNDMSEYFDTIVRQGADPIEAAKWIINELPDLSAKPQHLVELLKLKSSGEISGKMAKDILSVVKSGQSPSKIIKEKGLEQISDSGELQKIIDQIITENPDVVESVKKGKTQAIGFLVGRVMSKTQGKANPQVVNKLIRSKMTNK